MAGWVGLISKHTQTNTAPWRTRTVMERTTDMDKNETIDHPPSSRGRMGSKDDYRALLDSTEQNQQYEFVKKTPFGEVISVLQASCLDICI